MNEGDGSILSKETRKRKRGSGFRYSSKKVLERSKLKRAAKSRGSELASVTKALSFPFSQSSSGLNESGGPISLDIVFEQDVEKDLSHGNASTEGERILQVSTF
jgi:DNA-binding transcriptional MerR regulator